MIELPLRSALLLGAVAAFTACAQHDLLSTPGPAFKVEDRELPSPLTLIAYGDQRFTDPANTTDTNPAVRRLLVQRIADEKPAAVILNGDVPLAGRVKNDYTVFKTETQIWRAANLRVFPALGNHEFKGSTEECLENWWTAFPELRNRRWYSAQLGSHVYVIALDSDTSLLPGSRQGQWLANQIEYLPRSIEFVVLTMHHPPVADVQQHFEVGHNPRPNEIAVRDFLTAAAKRTGSRFIVSAGHIHNYERHEVEGVTYLVSGGSGAKPYPVERTPEDLYQSNRFPNYHYLKFIVAGSRLHATMYRLADPDAPAPAFEAKDSFEISFPRP